MLHNMLGDDHVTYNHFHDILRLFDGLPNFLFTTSETVSDYYLYTWYIRDAYFTYPLLCPQLT